MKNFKMNMFGVITIVLLVLAIAGISVFVFAVKGFVDLGGRASLNRLGGFGLNGTGGKTDDKVCYIVKSTRNAELYLKSFAYGDFDGKKLSLPKKYSKTLEGGYSAEYLTGSAISDGSNLVTLEITPKSSDYVLPSYICPYTTNQVIQKSDVEYKGNTRNKYSVNFVDVTSISEIIMRKNVDENYIEFEKEYRNYVYENYLNVPSSTKSVVDEIIAQNEFTKSNINIYDEVSSYLKENYYYSLEYDTNLDKQTDIVAAFLTDYQEGICQHFATSATMIYRALDIPARRVDGYHARAIADKEVEVTGNDAHAWVEVYIDGIGWCAIDVTGGREKVDKKKIEAKICDINIKSNDLDGMYGYQNEKVDSREGEYLKGALVDYLETIGGYYEIQLDGYAEKNGNVISINGDRNKQTGKIKGNNIKIFNSEGEDITSQFEVTIEDGEITKNKKTLVLKSKNREAHEGIGVLVGQDEDWECKGVEEGHRVEFSSEVQLSQCGYVKNEFTVNIYDSYTGENVTDEYAIDEKESKFGYLHMYRYEVSFTSLTADLTYNGQSLIEEYSGIEYTTFYFDGYDLKFEFEDYTIPGIYHNKFKVNIFDYDGKKMNYLFKINKKYGQINIKNREIEITTATCDDIYEENKTIKDESFTLTQGTLCEGDEIRVSNCATLSKIGSCANIMDIKIFDAEGNDVTKYYVVNIEYGTLRLRPQT